MKLIYILIFKYLKSKYQFFFGGVFSFLLVLMPLHAEVTNETIAVLVNKNDPESIEIANYYKLMRNVPNQNIIYLDFKKNVNRLSKAEFKKVEAQLNVKLPNGIEALALAWRRPWRVGCMSITTAFSLGFDEQYCAETCVLTKPIPFYNDTSQIFESQTIKLSMMLSANSVDDVKKLIDRGIEADYTRPEGTAYLLETKDKSRSIRAADFPKLDDMFFKVLDLNYLKTNDVKYKKDILFYFTGSKWVEGIKTNTYLPGGVADHLTSAGGRLFGSEQMSVLEWISAGLTGTYGTVVEPCNFKQKFSNPSVLMKWYLSGDTLIEAYWKSVKMPGQGVFVGEPLSSPFKGCNLKYNKFNVLGFHDYVPNNYVELKYKSCN